MAVAHEPKSATNVAAPPTRWWNSILVPLAILVVCGGVFAAPWVCLALGIDTNELPGELLAISQWIAPIAAAALILFWWLFLSSFGWITRIAVFLLLAGVVAGASAAGFIYCVRDVEFTKGRISLVPRFHFIWEETANDRLKAHLANQPKSTDDLPPIDDTIAPDDFPRYRGITFDGAVNFGKLHTDWGQHPPKVLWSHPCPGGYSGVAVAGKIVVTLEQREDGQTVVCCDRATGRERWTYLLEKSYKDENKMGDGPRSTPTIHNSHIYAIGATGELVCLSAEGKKKWSKNILADAKAKNVKWGLTSSPLIVDDLVVVNPGVDENELKIANPANSSLIAYEQATGKIRWHIGNRKASYSSPQLVTFNKTQQILLFDGDGLVGYDKAGKELWQFPWKTDFEMNSIQPVILDDNRIFISSEMPNGCAMLRIKAPENDQGSWSVVGVWHNKNLAARYANPVTDGKSIFGMHNLQGTLVCLDAGTGKVKWKGNREGPGQMLLGDGVLLVINGDTGDAALFDANAAECTELTRFRVFEKQDKTWNTPALAGDQLFVRNQDEIVCLKLPRR